MVRDSLTNTSRFAFVGSVNNGTKIVFIYRDIPGAPATTVNLTPHALPYWVKISKLGTSYRPFTSVDNITWTPAGAAVDLHFGSDITNTPHYGMAAASANNTLLSSGQIDNFTVTGSTPLPIRLLSFTAKKVNVDQVLVSWVTSMEHLVDHFEIQRGVDNSSFQTFDNTKAIGESETPHYYSVNDNNPVPGINYYRLKEIDKDGNFYFSPVVTVTFDEQEVFELYPNPADDYSNIISPRYPILEVNVYDITGKLLRGIKPAGGVNTYRLNTTDLQKGIYFIQVKTTTGIYRKKLFKR
jgi:hypothetical protein